MKALTFHGDRTVRYESIADPTLQDPADALVKVKLCAICGSDLHVYHGREQGCDHATAMGHEFVGKVVEVGKDVDRLKVGDLVMSPFSTSCGQCEYCLSGLTSRCIHSQLFGWRQHGKGLHGGQAEYVRVPQAEHTLLPIPSTISLEQALLLGDVIPTGYFCAHQADINPGKVYVVVGCGAVGLMTILGAFEQGATTVYAIDTLPERLIFAEAFGAIPIDASVRDPLQVVKAIHSQGADAVMEAVGNNESLQLAYNLVRPGGIISMVGVNTASTLPFSPADAYDKNLTLKVGRCPARFFMQKLLPMVASGKYDYTSIISHRMELRDGVTGYAMFSEKKDKCVKVLLHCS
ncbi:MAG: alcohol dehydrogenase family protein [Cyclobacteriaceae bacterium]|nr:alcohol dehydrogenase family protein [Cyclobacteriaceae bacterium]MDH5251015.1 alcohol dehydrogenase family protein [Cyclobacteriaceae bacterium]